MSSLKASTVEYVPSGHSFSGYLGGKSKLSKTIIEMMPPHMTYCEVFAGVAWVLFRKTPSPVEFINDINSDLVNLFRVIKYHFIAFLIEFENVLVSREEYDRLKAMPSNCLTDLQRAVKFYYLLRLAYGTKLVGQNFSLSTERASRLKLGNELKAHLLQVHERLQRVAIENQGFSAFITSKDKESTLFYIDPPYYGCENDYGKDIFSRDDFIKLRDQLLGIKGKFILSLNDVDPVRELFADFNIKSVELRYSVRGIAADKMDKEVLITNF